MTIRLARDAGLLLACVPFGLASAQEPPPPPPPSTPPPVSTLPVAEAESPDTGALLADSSRLSFRASATWGTLDGSEVENADPALGVEAAASFRVFGPLSVWGGFATATHKVEGQVLQLLDQPVRPDQRSGTVDGEISNRRLRGGIRLDGMRQANVRVVPYVVLGAMWVTTEVTIDKVDGAPPRPVRNEFGYVVDISKFEDSRLGCMARAGIEWRFAGALGVDAHATYELLEFPPGAAGGVSAGGGLTYRL